MASSSSSSTSPAVSVRSLSASSAGQAAGSGKFIEKIWAAQKSGKPFFSFEYFPPKTDEGLSNLYLRFDRMGALGPVRCLFFGFLPCSLCLMRPTDHFLRIIGIY
jgi:hypothetical protein